MKQLNITFEDEEHEKLIEKKEESGLNWHDFILKSTKIEIQKK